MSKIVNTTQKHIDEGVQGSPCNCALALAVKDAYGLPRSSSEVSVNATTIAVKGKSVHTQPAQSRFVRDFDASKAKVSPHKFVLDI